MNPHVSWTRRADQRYTVALKGEEDVGVVQEIEPTSCAGFRSPFLTHSMWSCSIIMWGSRSAQVSTLYESTSTVRTQRIRTSSSSLAAFDSSKNVIPGLSADCRTPTRFSCRWWRFPIRRTPAGFAPGLSGCRSAYRLGKHALARDGGAALGSIQSADARIHSDGAS